MNEGKAKLI